MFLSPTFLKRLFSISLCLFIFACGGSDSDPSNNNSPNRNPVADAGADQNIIIGQTVNLDGTGSTDADGDTLSYNWTVTDAPTASSSTLSSETSTNPSFTPDVAGTYTIQLIQNDGVVDSNAASVTVTVASSGSNTAIFDSSTFDSGAVYDD